MKQTLLTAVQILILLNPFAVLSTFLALTPGWTQRDRTRVVNRATAAIILTGIALFFGGSVIFAAFGIDIDVFRVGGGIILMVCSITLVWSREKASRPGDDPGQDIAVVPIAVPMAIGPGTAAGLIIIGLENREPLAAASALFSLLIAVALLAGLLYISTQAERLLGKRGITIVTRLTGLFLSAIAASMILSGIRNYFHLG